MKLVTLILLTALIGLAHSAPATIFGQAGVPNPWDLSGIAIILDSLNLDHLVVNVNIDADVSVDSATADGTRHWDFTATTTDDPAANAEVNGGYFAYDINGGSNGTFTVNGLEGVVRSRFADEAMTARGVYGRVYIDPDSTATIRTGIGGEFSARASYSGGTAIAAENGTAFVGARIWMAPYFSAGTVNNVNNFWGLWIYGEHTTQRNADAAICIEDAGGGFTYGVDMVDALISIAEIRGQNAETIDNATDGFWDLASDLILGRGTVGDEDISAYADTGGTPFEWFQYDEGGERTDWIGNIRYEGTANFTVSPTTMAPALMVIDWDNIAGGVGELGMTDDTTRIPADAYLDVEGVAWFDSLVTFAQAIDVDSTDTDHLVVNESGDSITVGAWTRYLMIAAGAAGLGPTAPSWVTVETIGALAFDADAETAYITKEIPDDWNGSSDMTLKIYWTNEPADAIADTETVKFDISYRSLIWGTEDVDNNAAVAGTVTYTQSGAGTDGETFEHSITLDYDHGDQPLTAGDVLCIQFDRDVTGDTYAGDAYVVQWEIVYTSTGLPNHN